MAVWFFIVWRRLSIVDFSLDGRPGLDAAGKHLDKMGDGRSPIERVGTRARVPSFERVAGVADLAACFGIKRGAVQDNFAGLAGSMVSAVSPSTRIAWTCEATGAASHSRRRRSFPETACGHLFADFARLVILARALALFPGRR